MFIIVLVILIGLLKKYFDSKNAENININNKPKKRNSINVFN
jgi:hypothetical protein